MASTKFVKVSCLLPTRTRFCTPSMLPYKPGNDSRADIRRLYLLFWHEILHTAESCMNVGIRSLYHISIVTSSVNSIMIILEVWGVEYFGHRSGAA